MKDIMVGAAAGFGATTALFAFVFWTGATFGQRCEKAFPSDPARAELCVYNLKKGLAP